MACAKATKEAMERLVQAGSLAPLSVRTLAGFSVAGLGVGCYRMGLKQADVLLHTLRQGSVNVIDTSSTYVAGDSERMIGHVLSTPELRGRRRELVVVSKVGYLQGPLLAEAVEREATGRLWPEVRPCPCNARDQSFLSHARAAFLPQVAKFHPQAWHCIHPDFLRHQLAASRQRLGSSPDLVLLHNPEFFFTSILGEGGAQAPGPRAPSEEDQSEFYRRIEAAFVALEQAADEGHLSSYGLSTNPAGCRWSCSGLDNLWEATSLERIMAAAHAAARSLGKAAHRCRVIQLPLNLLEPDALIGAASEGRRAGELSVIAQAKQLGLDVMTHRPINAIPPKDFHIGDWARRESFVKLRDRRPQPPALALIASVCRDVLTAHKLPAFYHGGLGDLALHTALSAPVSVALSGPSLPFPSPLPPSSPRSRFPAPLYALRRAEVAAEGCRTLSDPARPNGSVRSSILARWRQWAPLEQRLCNAFSPPSEGGMRAGQPSHSWAIV